MKKSLLLLIIIALMLTPLIACKVAEGEADDIIPAPGLGPQYRANVHEQGVKNPWPPIDSAEVTVGEPPDIAKITYRDYIETEAGQTRNNLFTIYLPNAAPTDTTYIETVLQAVDVPSGINVTQDDWEWHGADPARHSKTALIIEIAPQLGPGDYVFDFNVNINTKDHGTIPCTIHVISS
jgi:hypothetical protein